jgi:dUTP pyrophosphatase
MKVGIVKLKPQAILPTRSRVGDAGYDLFACESAIIPPLERRVIPIGIAIEIPEGYYGRIAPRSGLAVKKGIDVLAGVVDSGYRDEIGVVLINLNQIIESKSPSATAYKNLFGSSNSFSISKGDRIAQLIIEKYYDIEWEEKNELNISDRGQNGFGSTGL